MENPKDRGGSSKQAGILCVSTKHASALVKTLREAGYQAWPLPSLESESDLPDIVPDLVLLENAADYLTELAKSLWPKAVILQCSEGEDTSSLLRRIRSALKKP